MSSTRRPTPEEMYLQRKRVELDALEKQLAEREAEFRKLREGLSAFEQKYQAIVTEKYDQLDALHARMAELTSGVGEAPGAGGHGPDGNGEAPVEQQGGAPGSGWSARLPPPRRGRHGTASAKGGDKPTPESLKRLYRDVAKALHPDKAETEESREHRHRFMSRANAAYEASDEPRLRLIFEEWEQSAESVRGQGAGPDLVRAIRRIAWCEQRMVLIEMDTRQIQGSGAFGMKQMAEEAAMFQRDFLAEMTERLDEEIAAAKEQLQRLEKQKESVAAVPPAAPAVAKPPSA